MERRQTMLNSRQCAIRVNDVSLTAAIKNNAPILLREPRHCCVRSVGSQRLFIRVAMLKAKAQGGALRA